MIYSQSIHIENGVGLTLKRMIVAYSSPFRRLNNSNLIAVNFEIRS